MAQIFSVFCTIKKYFYGSMLCHGIWCFIPIIKQQYSNTRNFHFLKKTIYLHLPITLLPAYSYTLHIVMETT